MRPVTKVIRNREGLYFKLGGGWTAYFEAAGKFPDTKDVIDTVRRFDLPEVDLVIVVSDKPSREWDVVLPLGHS